MSSSKPYLRLLLAMACVVVSIAALLNVFADNDDVVAQAKARACPTGPCDMARMDRSPFAQTFAFRAQAGEVTVRCSRATVFFGAYSCARE
jgi:hypothetical protein